MQPGDEAFGFHVNRIAAVLNGVNPIPLTFGPITVLGTTTLNTLVYTWPSSIGAAGYFLQTNGAGGILSWQPIVAGVSSVTGTANQVTASPTTGAVVVGLPSGGTLPGSWTAATGFTITAGGETITAGNLTLSAGSIIMNGAGAGLGMGGTGQAYIIGGTLGLGIYNNAATLKNIDITDPGVITIRNALSIPPSAGGTVAATSYGSVPVKIASTILGATATSVTFSSIPQAFAELESDFMGRSALASVSEELIIRPNNDATAVYENSRNYGNNAAVTPQGFTAQTFGYTCFFPGASAPANVWGHIHSRLMDYTSTAHDKNIISVGSHNQGYSLGNSYLIHSASIWRPATPVAITSLVFATSGGSSFVVGSKFILKGNP